MPDEIKLKEFIKEKLLDLQREIKTVKDQNSSYAGQLLGSLDAFREVRDFMDGKHESQQ